MIITAGSVDKSLYFYIVGNASHAAPGDPITGLLFSDIETGGSASYLRQGASRVDLTLVSLVSPSAAHVDGGFIEVDATNMPGIYRCDFPDAAWLSGVDQVICDLVVAAVNNAKVDPVVVDLSVLDIRGAVGQAINDQFDGVTGLIGDTYPANQEQIGNLSVSGSAVNAAAESYVLTTGTLVSGTVDDTRHLDGTSQVHADAAGSMDLYYEFDITEEGAPTSFTLNGRINGNNDDLNVYAYDWVASEWDQIGTINGKSGSASELYNFILYYNKVGQDDNAGLVRIRFANTGLSSALFHIDQMYVSLTILYFAQYTKGVVEDLSPTNLEFSTNLTSVTNAWNDNRLEFVSGVLKGQSKPISTCVNIAGKVHFTFDGSSPAESFTTDPADGDRFIIAHDHIHPVSQIQEGLAIEYKQDVMGANIDQLLDNQNTFGIKKNVALPNFAFPMKLSSDHYTAALGKTVTGEMRIDNGTYIPVNGTITEVSDGTYEIDLTADDTNGDVITYRFSSPGCDDTQVTILTNA